MSRSSPVTDLGDIVLVDVHATAFHLEQRAAVEDVGPLGDHDGVLPNLDAGGNRRHQLAGAISPPVAAVVVMHRERVAVGGTRVDLDKRPPDARLIHQIGRNSKAVGPFPPDMLRDVLKPEPVLHDRSAERVVVVEAVIGLPRV